MLAHRTVGSTFHPGCLMTGAQAAAVVPYPWVRCTLSRPALMDLPLQLLLQAYLRKGVGAQASMQVTTSVAGLKPWGGLAGWHALSGKMAVLASMLEKLKPLGDRIVVVSNSTQVLDLIGALCRECHVSHIPLPSQPCLHRVELGAVSDAIKMLLSSSS